MSLSHAISPTLRFPLNEPQPQCTVHCLCDCSRIAELKTVQLVCPWEYFTYMTTNNCPAIHTKPRCAEPVAPGDQTIRFTPHVLQRSFSVPEDVLRAPCRLCLRKSSNATAKTPTCPISPHGSRVCLCTSAGSLRRVYRDEIFASVLPVGRLSKIESPR